MNLNLMVKLNQIQEIINLKIKDGSYDPWATELIGKHCM